MWYVLAPLIVALYAFVIHSPTWAFLGFMMAQAALLFVGIPARTRRDVDKRLLSWLVLSSLLATLGLLDAMMPLGVRSVLYQHNIW
ncbi:hypothetical protein [Chthonobacter rhizosphaerae]|uniref:hypothetical protein n=1 Tax=Chthonobacter rhizosphaerae TaxID=2735553 RepID=UPI0015EF6679|nr:hypothetical protein [Chthonobacter rhizosphaerae]